jgi:uncharacterized pyridoxamine 5'-phosphate oxidase family protein
MNMAMVKKLMKEVCCGAFATTDGEKVGVRPMSGWAWIEKELWCATDEGSDKIAQLRKVPYAEYCFCNKDGLHVRIAGACTISCDNADKLRLYEANPGLKDHIEDPASPEYVVIRLKPESIRLMNPPDLVYQNIELE